MTERLPIECNTTSIVVTEFSGIYGHYGIAEQHWSRRRLYLIMRETYRTVADESRFFRRNPTWAFVQPLNGERTGRLTGDNCCVHKHLQHRLDSRTERGEPSKRAKWDNAYGNRQKGIQITDCSHEWFEDWLDYAKQNLTTGPQHDGNSS